MTPALFLALALISLPRQHSTPIAEESVTPASASAPVEGDDLAVGLLTFGPGEEAFFKFGHNGIWIQNQTTHQSRIYNFGTFAFDTALLIPQFLKGRLKYWLSVQGIGETLYEYQSSNRSVDVQVLNLTPQQKRELSDALEQNARPENAYYKYDYYRDNCSTRVRDAIDRVLGGTLAARFQQPGQYTWRQHTDRCVADTYWEYLGLNITMGDFIDQPITRWQEMFLPEKLQQGLREVPGLVASERRLVETTREGIRAVPPRRVWLMFAIGAGLEFLLLLLGQLARRRPGFRALLAVPLATVGLFLGLFGSIFILLWAATDHAVAYHNENILLVPPWLMALPFFARAWIKGRPRGMWFERLLGAAMVSSLAALALKLVPLFDQDDHQFLALLIPFWIGAWLATRAGRSVATQASAR